MAQTLEEGKILRDPILRSMEMAGIDQLEVAGMRKKLRVDFRSEQPG